MTGDVLPEIRDFVGRYVHSVAVLELLLFLNTHSPRCFSVVELSREMRSNDSFIESLLEGLCGKGLLSLAAESGEKRYCYAPKSDSEKKLVDALAALYAQKRVTIIDLIYQGPVEKMRTFADAFKLRK